MPTLLEWIIGGIALFIGLLAPGIAICWLIKDPEGKRLVASDKQRDDESDSIIDLAAGLTLLIRAIVKMGKGKDKES